MLDGCGFVACWTESVLPCAPDLSTMTWHFSNIMISLNFTCSELREFASSPSFVSTYNMLVLMVQRMHIQLNHTITYWPCSVPKRCRRGGWDPISKVKCGTLPSTADYLQLYHCTIFFSSFLTRCLLSYMVLIIVYSFSCVDHHAQARQSPHLAFGSE